MNITSLRWGSESETEEYNGRKNNRDRRSSTGIRTKYVTNYSDSFRIFEPIHLPRLQQNVKNKIKNFILNICRSMDTIK
jgi:hypothetical protein